MNEPASWAGIGPGDRGTPAADWARWLAERAPDPEFTVPDGCRRLVVVAPHPDDEILGVGITASRFAAAGVDVTVVAVTDGDASHPDSPTLTPQRLAELRVEESRRACTLLGLPEPVRLGLPDGRVREHRARLADALVGAVGDPGHDTLVLTTWRGDGHPDHEASGRAAADACAATGARLVEYPVWTWHWAPPGDPRVPWGRRRRVVLTDVELAAKRAAVAEFVTQVAPLSALPGDEAILPDWIVDRLVTREETVFW
ncbi:PIG-L deacetylase family protein [Dietzia psychralcaliphila]|uniref:PIG-L deacetylase family protein n=1 Tax=Dietzia psychralcaliphila TaxID=139021 RepID=UPI001C1E7000|nr:PIG-L family deacetylase [Dietzia psychralcaliphila]